MHSYRSAVARVGTFSKTNAIEHNQKAAIENLYEQAAAGKLNYLAMIRADGSQVILGKQFLVESIFIVSISDID